MPRTARLLASALVLAATTPGPAAPGVPLSLASHSDETQGVYLEKVKPLLSKHCYRCHGPERQESGLRLDRRGDAFAGGDRGPAIVPGEAGESRLIRFISGDDPDVTMPPDGETLEPESVNVLRKWIDDGADWPE